MDENNKNHRERLKARYLKGGRKALADYEILELLLFYAIPRKDTKPLAKKLISDSGSLKNVFEKNIDELKNFQGIGAHSSILIKLVKDIIIEYFEPDHSEQIVLSSPEAVSEFIQKDFKENQTLIPYLKAELGGNNREFFMILCLNSLNQLLHKEVLFLGTLDQAQVYPREIIKMALLKNAASIIIVHNHPSGSSKPSLDDINLTEKIEDLAKDFGIRLHDHIVVSSNQAYSIKARRYLTF